MNPLVVIIRGYMLFKVKELWCWWECKEVRGQKAISCWGLPAMTPVNIFKDTRRVQILNGWVHLDFKGRSDFVWLTKWPPSCFFYVGSRSFSLLFPQELIARRIVKETMHDLNLNDCYRELIPTGGFTWQRQNIMSRLDMILVSSGKATKCTGAEVDWNLIDSDHAGVKLWLEVRKNNVWRSFETAIL